MDEDNCQVCTESLDATDSSINFCDCNIALCLWCWHRICEDAAKDNLPARCPNCRTEYDQERIRKQRLDPVQLEEVKRKQQKKEDKKKAAPNVKSRKDLVNVRVVQRNLVYVVGLAMELCHEDILKGPDYFGQFGKIVKISVSRGGPYGTAAAKNGPTGSAYITYKRAVDAKHCIETVHGAVWEGKAMKACYGTTKYCNAFLKGLQCNNADCLYLHDVADEEDSYTKEETKTPKFVNLVHAASIQKQASMVLQTQQSAPLNGGTPRSQSGQGQSAAVSPEAERSVPTSSTVPEPLSDQQAPASSMGWPALGGASWAAKATTASAPQLPPPPPPVEASTQEWPELPGASNADAGEGGGVARVGPVPPVAPVTAQLQRKGSTMAAELARAASTPNGMTAGAAKEPASKPPVGNTVLVVPKKKPAALASMRTPRKHAEAGAAKAQDAGKPVGEVVSSSTTPAEAAETTSPAVAADSEKSLSAQGEPDGAHGMQAVNQETPFKELQGQGQGQKVEAAGETNGFKIEGVQAESANADGSGRAKSTRSGPPPGFDGSAKPSGRPKKGPPPGFAYVADQPAHGSSGSPFQSYGSESSSTTQVMEQSSPATALASVWPVSEWDIATKLPNLDSIFGSSDIHAPVDALFLPQSNRSRSRFDFAQDSSNSSSEGRPQGEVGYAGNLQGAPSEIHSLRAWMPADSSSSHSSHAFPSSDPAGMALLRQLQGGAGAGLNGYGLSGYASQFSGFAGFMAPAQNGKMVAQQQSQQQAGTGGSPGFGSSPANHLNGFHHQQGASGLAVHAPPMPSIGQDAQSLEARWLGDSFRNMAV